LDPVRALFREMSIRTDLGRTSIHGGIQKLGISVINPVRRDIGGGGNSPKDLRSSRHAVNHSLSKLLGKSIDSPTGAVSIGPRSGAQMEKYWRRRERQVKTRKLSNEFADFGGGGGSRTRVRKHVVVGLYMRVRICFLMPGVRTRPKPPDTSLGESRGHAPRRRVATSLFNGVRPSTTRRGQGERHCLIKQRERTDYPQLTDVPPD